MTTPKPGSDEARKIADDGVDNANVTEFSARLSDTGDRAVITVAVSGVTTRVRLTRQQTFELAQTLMLMTGSMR